jgi:hypothetical protein
MENMADMLAPPAGELTDTPATSPQAAAVPSQLDFEPVPLAWRSDGWTPERQRAFIEELADCGVVREAASRVGMTEQSAYGLRRRPDAEAFNKAWDTAVHMGTERLQSIAVERAIQGTIRRRYFQGEVVGEERVHDNRLLIYLLGRTHSESRDFQAANRIGEWRQWIDAVEDEAAKPMPGPAARNAPVWRGPDGKWVTNFPPPDGFDGEQGVDKHGDYCRRLSAEEQTAVEAWERRANGKAHRRRDLYFRRLMEDETGSLGPNFRHASA